jgi:hypothetical protein
METTSGHPSGQSGSSQNRLQPGQVIYLFCPFTSPPKVKFLVIASLSSSSALVFPINSQKGPYLCRRPWLLKCQVPIQASDYGFLDHDSFIDCGNVHRLYQSDIEDEIRADPTTIKGELHASTKQEILHVVQEATTISKRDKDLIVAGLS